MTYPLEHDVVAALNQRPKNVVYPVGSCMKLDVDVCLYLTRPNNVSYEIGL